MIHPGIFLKVVTSSYQLRQCWNICWFCYLCYLKYFYVPAADKEFPGSDSGTLLRSNQPHINVNSHCKESYQWQHKRYHLFPHLALSTAHMHTHIHVHTNACMHTPAVSSAGSLSPAAEKTALKLPQWWGSRKDFVGKTLVCINRLCFSSPKVGRWHRSFLSELPQPTLRLPALQSRG